MKACYAHNLLSKHRPSMNRSCERKDKHMDSSRYRNGSNTLFFSSNKLISEKLICPIRTMKNTKHYFI